MGTFDTRNDTPLLLNKEALDITLKFDRTGPTTGRISWNIPTPAGGCTAETQAYCGIILTLDTVPSTIGIAPVDGTVYVGDPTGDTNLHSGDKVGSALVVGAFYNDRTTVFVDVSGLQPNSVYYVAGYPHDCVNRYYTAGIYAYSLDYALGSKTEDANGYQMVKVGESGVLPTDATGLVPGTIYQFKIVVDGAVRTILRDPGDITSGESTVVGTSYTVSVNGTDAQTYEDLVETINRELQKLENPPVSPTAPNAGGYYWDSTNQKLYQWDGSVNVLLPAIVEPTQPNTPAIGDYWYDPISKILSQWDGLAWVAQNVIEYLHDPRLPTCEDYWFTGTVVYLWNGTTWCVQTLYNQTVDPSLDVEPACGTHWYDENTEHLNVWNTLTKAWDPTMAILWDTDPTALTPGTFWFDDVNETLFELDNPNPGWNDVSLSNVVTISETEPTAPAINSYWYNPVDEELQQWNGVAFVDVPVLIWSSDPAVQTSCLLWWNTTNDTLRTWDATTSSWDLITNFVISASDPAAIPTLPVGVVWYHPTTKVLSKWDGSSWIVVSYINYATDPTLPAINDTWHNTTTGEWSVWNGLVWVVFNPTDSETDPTIPVAGDYWFNTSTNALNQWNGSAWITLLYSTTSLAPATGTKWYDLINNVLKVWDGAAWQIATPLAHVDLNADGHLIFTSSTTGHTSSIFLTDVSLFAALPFGTQLLGNIYGTDGVSDKPSYMAPGIGTDGTPDQRLHMIEELRTLLGHPTVVVELTNQQLDFCISNALENLRRNSSIPYKQGYFFLYTVPGKQSYILSNKGLSFDKIVTIMGAYRMVSAFLTTVQGAGAYGQIVLQHLYNMGSFDILSYFLVSQYVEQLEQIFASRLTFNWNEQTRTLRFNNTFARTEVIALDATVERTEQDILADRWTKNWIQNYALANAKSILAGIRGKYATLPGAGGGVALNAADLRTQAEEGYAKCQQELEDFIVNDVESYGIGSTIAIG